METLERVLAQHPFFEGLPPDQLKLLAGCAANTRFPAGAYLSHRGDEANQLFLLRQGRVALESFAPHSPPITIATFEKDDLLGWSWMAESYHWHFDARAVEATRAISLDARCLRSKCEQNRDLGYDLLKRFARLLDQNLQATRLQLLDVYAPRRHSRS